MGSYLDVYQLKNNEITNKSNESLYDFRFLVIILALLVGFYIYVLTREPINSLIESFQFYFMDFIIIDNSALYGALPSFSHILIFVLLTSFFILSSRVNNLLNVLSWSVINIFFEVLQGSGFAGGAIKSIFINSDYCFGVCKGYFTQGTFDILDIGAVLFGGVTAYIVLEFKRGCCD